jgi:hypothetical protein
MTIGERRSSRHGPVTLLAYGFGFVMVRYHECTWPFVMTVEDWVQMAREVVA